jgi:hypothetical protein
MPLHEKIRIKVHTLVKKVQESAGFKKPSPSLLLESAYGAGFSPIHTL